ncbi:hypothetical protein bwei_1762 [Bacillus mycoides]|uniref:hypothetical protein n=1 Tax=Bacillus mycoides TaxID=1405 RepID=UPI0001A046DC|nr:hypothetical protein [Bacillus mycoides]EEL05469.1 hypothetical protein bcere0014_30340 [Bacillus cereus BDRD-ST196]AIW84407.1 hypothetical protein bwei_1762 [Bacillus mycoides]QWH01647.1 hypothetical protein EXW52_16240 [Bacillus mycoides]GAE42464.1 hypothetical protein BW1_066_01140 [Bacillus mycoides NBRC 101238 = DSM 11821]HDR7596060.1 hypothetical protein [Bacillus mycoides]
MNIYLMKTYQEWAERFINNDQPFVALDEPGINLDYGKLSNADKTKLFKELDENADKKRRWGQIQTFFDRFYVKAMPQDIVVIGTGQMTKFNVSAIVRVTSDAYYIDSPDSWDSRHRRDVEVLWSGEPFQVEKWGWARRLEVLDSTDRLKEFIEVYTKLK